MDLSLALAVVVAECGSLVLDLGGAARLGG